MPRLVACFSTAAAGDGFYPLDLLVVNNIAEIDQASNATVGMGVLIRGAVYAGGNERITCRVYPALSQGLTSLARASGCATTAGAIYLSSIIILNIY
jgi:hypothetical protein